MVRLAKQRVYLVGGLPWGSEYLFAHVWWCGDEWCDCTQAQIERVGPNRTAGPPFVIRESVWEGEFYTDGEQGAEADLQQHLAELEAAGEIEVITQEIYLAAIGSKRD